MKRPLRTDEGRALQAARIMKTIAALIQRRIGVFENRDPAQDAFQHRL